MPFVPQQLCPCPPRTDILILTLSSIPITAELSALIRSLQFNGSKFGNSHRARCNLLVSLAVSAEAAGVSHLEMLCWLVEADTSLGNSQRWWQQGSSISL